MEQNPQVCSLFIERLKEGIPMRKKIITFILFIFVATSVATTAQTKPLTNKPVNNVKVTKNILKPLRPYRKPTTIKTNNTSTKLSKTTVDKLKPYKPFKKPLPRIPIKGIGTNNGNGKPIQKGITTNNMLYTVITDVTTLPTAYNDNVNDLKSNRGYYYSSDGKGYLFSIFSGEKSTGGYGINVVSVQDVEGITTITVAETEPPKGGIVNMMVTYPTVTIALDHVNERTKVINTDGEELNHLLIK